MSSAIEKIDRVLALVQRMSKKVDYIEDKIDEALFELDEERPAQEVETNGRRFDQGYEHNQNVPDEETIRKYGEKIPYLKYSGEDADRLREFIFYIRSNAQMFSRTEYVTAGYADKNFEDLRISLNTHRLLNTAYKKIHQSKDMPWRATTGWLYKYQMHKAWEWDE